MSWIKTIPYEAADSHLRRTYDRVKGPNNNIDNVLLIHSLRPHTLTGHMTLYKSVLHNSNNTLPKWYLEALGVYVSYLNNCNYCVAHHLEGLKRLWQEEEKAARFYEAVQQDTLSTFFEDNFLSGMQYAKQLTLRIQGIQKEAVEQLQTKGFFGWRDFGNQPSSQLFQLCQPLCPWVLG